MKLNKKTIIAIYLFAAIALTLQVASISFNPTPPDTFNISEDDNFTYDVNVTSNETFVNFTKENTPSYPNITITANNGTLTFTPLNDDVGVTGYFLIIVRNISNPTDFITTSVRFNITNTNDNPNITAFLPSAVNTSVQENSSIIFNYTVSDDDLINGEIINATWWLNGTLQTRNDTFNFTPDYCEAGFYNVTLVINDTFNITDSQTWNLTVNNTNRIPLLNQSFTNKTWQEDTTLPQNLTLTDFFSDNDTLSCTDDENIDNFTFSAIGNSSIIVTINETTHNVTFSAPANYYGVEIVFFTAFDGTNTTFSNNITLNVTNVNDAPEFNHTNQSLFADVVFLYDINATDPDNEIVSGTDNLTYYDNTSIFDINDTTGIISFTPNTSHIGFHPINISVDDGVLNTSHLVYFNISNNTAPVLNTIGDFNGTEGIRISFLLEGFDLDNDTINFTTNFTGFTIIIVNSTTQNFTFVPDNSNVGNTTIQFNVTDARGAVDSETITMGVNNVNNPPILQLIQNQTIKVGELWDRNISATDLDLEALTFSENGSFFEFTSLNNNLSQLNFTPKAADAGIHVINISVTDGPTEDFQLVVFTIQVNTGPVLNTIGNFTFSEDETFTLDINSSDLNNDTLQFSVNTSIFNFTQTNISSVLIDFIPDQPEVGIHFLNFSVSDGTLEDHEVVFFNITFKNDTPHFDPVIPPLNVSIGNSFHYDVNGTDDENDSITYLSNATFFNISNTTGAFNFTPTNDDIQNYTINFTITDGMNQNSTLVIFRVLPENIAANITATVPSGNNVTAAEGFEILFNVTAVDVNEDPLSYAWYLNGTERNTSQAWFFTPGFTEAGFYNLSIIVFDGLVYTTLSKNLTINNTNRAPKFGILNRSSFADFNSGNKSRTNITQFNNSIALARSDGVNYFSGGNYTSPILDLTATTNLTFTNISWNEILQASQSIRFVLRSSPDNTTFTNFSGNGTFSYHDYNGSTINTSSNRFIQYKAIMESNVSSTTPIIDDVAIHYKISDFYGREDTVYLNYLDLDDFFEDPDGESLSFSSTPVENIDISIDSENRVTLTPDSDFFGTRYVTFYASDGADNTSSNNVTISLADISEPGGSSTTTIISAGGGGGGGSSTVIVIQEKTVIVNKSTDFELVVPQNPEFGLNKEITVPVILQNNDDFDYTGILLTYTSNFTESPITLEPRFLEKLEAGQTEEVTLKIGAINESNFFTVKVFANVTDPEVSDSAIININAIDNISQEIKFVRDFVRLNPECLELNELIEKAQEELKNNNRDRAQVILDKAINSCKYLLSARKLQVQQPDEFSTVSRILSNPYTSLVIVLTVFVISLLIAYVFYNRWKWY